MTLRFIDLLRHSDRRSLKCSSFGDGVYLILLIGTENITYFLVIVMLPV